MIRQMGKSPTRIIRLLGFAVVLTISGIFTNRVGSRIRASQPDIIPVIQSVDAIALELTSSYTRRERYTGTIQPRRSSELGFERSGLVAQVMVNTGDIVEAGQTLAILSTQTLDAQEQELLAQQANAQAQLQELQAGPRLEEIAEAEATLRDANAQLVLAQARNQRRQNLLAAGAISQEEYDETASEEAALLAKRDAAAQRLQVLEKGTRAERIAAQQATTAELEARGGTLNLQRRQSVLRAPFDGQIAQRLIDEGAVVTAGQGILRLVEWESPEAHIGLPVDVAERLALGSLKPIEVAGHTYEARLNSLLPELTQSTRTATAVFQIVAQIAPSQLFAGQIANLELARAGESSGYWIPTTALVSSERGLWAVYVLVPSSSGFELAQQDVEVIHIEGDRVLIQGSLEQGEQIVADGINQLVPGQQVTPNDSSVQAPIEQFRQ